MEPLFTNSILVTNGSDCVIIDAWGKSSDWEQFLEKRGLNLIAIYSTHGHYDHISAAPELSEKFNVNWHLNYNDLDMVIWANVFLPQYGLPEIPNNYKKPIDLKDSNIEILPGIRAQIIECHGHSPGGVSIYFENEKHLITGDTIFRNGIGRYDFPGGNAQQLFNSISRLHKMNLPDDIIVIHGHDENSTIGWLCNNHKYFKL